MKNHSVCFSHLFYSRFFTTWESFRFYGKLFSGLLGGLWVSADKGRSRFNAAIFECPTKSLLSQLHAPQECDLTEIKVDK